jgi:hypothetical protein
MSKSFQVVAIIKKLLSFWKDFRHHFKHKLINMGVEDFIQTLKIKAEK